jgi:hypothetical protein
VGERIDVCCVHCLKPSSFDAGALVLRDAANQYSGLYSSFVATTAYAVYGLQADTLSATNVRATGIQKRYMIALTLSGPVQIAALSQYMRDFGARMVALYRCAGV